MKKILVNLKDWLGLNENIEFSKKIKNFDITLFPGMPYLHIYKDSGVTLGSQDVSSFASGSHTGSVSITHLLEFGIKSVLLNHNELRIESDDILFGKVRQALAHNVNIVICINDTSDSELSRITRLFEDLKDTSLISLAYEPIKDKKVEEIKSDLDKIKGTITPHKIGSLIYGGNVSKENIQLYNDELNVDGYLISRHALDIDELTEIVNLAR